MSDWYRFPRAPKKPPPEHGIKMKKAGSTWWGQRWIAALEQVLRGDAGRLARGRTYARAGRTHDLVIEGGTVRAKVTGSRATPYEVEMHVRQLSADVWSAAIAGMAAKAQFSAELLAAEMPRDIDEVFRAAGASLFPARRSDLQTQCSCPDWGDPCKHVAATHYVLGEALDRDPFLLFELRGRSKAQVLEEVRAARGGGDEGAASAPEIPSVRLPELEAADYDRPLSQLPALQFSFDAPLAHGAVLQQLGKPLAWSGDTSPAEALAPLLRAAAESARRIALSDSPPPADTEPVREHDAPPHDTADSQRARRIASSNAPAQETADGEPVPNAAGAAKRQRRAQQPATSNAAERPEGRQPSAAARERPSGSHPPPPAKKRARKRS
jgi:uncharacterized Zn finger protein